MLTLLFSLALATLLFITHSVSASCCADGTREAFTNAVTYPDICGCAVNSFVDETTTNSWAGFRALNSPKGTDGPSDSVCGTGFSVCSIAQFRANVPTAAECRAAGSGRFQAGFSHADLQVGDAMDSLTCTYLNAGVCLASGYGSEPVCCGSDCLEVNACKDQIFTGQTEVGFDTWATGEGCGSVQAATAGGVLCCRDTATTTAAPTSTQALRTPTPVPMCVEGDLADRPGGNVAWDACTTENQQYCYEFTSVGVPEGGTIAPWVAFLDQNSTNWAVRWSEDINSLPASVADTYFTLTLRLGTLATRYTSAIATVLDTTISGDACLNNSRIVITGRPAFVNWLNYDVTLNCAAGYCGDDTTRANYSGRIFSGNTQNMGLWEAGERNMFEGMEVSTGAQYRPTVLIYGSYPVPSLYWSMGNAHLPADGSATPCEGSMLIFAPERFWLSMGFPNSDAAFDTLTDGSLRLIRSLTGGGSLDWSSGGSGLLSLSLTKKIVGERTTGLYLFVRTAFSVPNLKLEFKSGGDAGSGATLYGVGPTVNNPGVPVLKSVVGQVGGKVKLTFAPPPGSTVDGFKAICTMSGVNTTKLAAGSATSLVVPISGSAGRNVSCALQALNSAGFGTASSALVALVPVGAETTTRTRTTRTRSQTKTRTNSRSVTGTRTNSKSGTATRTATTPPNTTALANNPKTTTRVNPKTSTKSKSKVSSSDGVLLELATH